MSGRTRPRTGASSAVFPNRHSLAGRRATERVGDWRYLSVLCTAPPAVSAKKSVYSRLIAVGFKNAKTPTRTGATAKRRIHHFFRVEADGDVKLPPAHLAVQTPRLRRPRRKFPLPEQPPPVPRIHRNQIMEQRVVFQNARVLVPPTQVIRASGQRASRAVSKGVAIKISPERPELDHSECASTADRLRDCGKDFHCRQQAQASHLCLRRVGASLLHARTARDGCRRTRPVPDSGA